MRIETIDLYVIIAFFLLMVAIGIWSYFKNSDAADYFVAGGKLPWWLSGISHHVSGYSGAVFVAYAAIAYTHGFTIYVWWALTIGITVIASAKLFPALWVRLRLRYQIQSPLEYLENRYNIATQQIMAWSGVVLKLFDVGAKWAAIGILMNVFIPDMPINVGILIAGGISLLYITIGGLWAVILTDFTQFLVQIIAGVVMFIVTLKHLDGIESIITLWDQLPEQNSHWFNGEYSVGFALAFLFINFFSYNGGTWNLATRYISSPSEKESSKAAYLSGILYLVWPLILFFPMWAAPILLPDLIVKEEAYGQLIFVLLPKGLIGLVIASLFANTMSMTSSDANTIAAVITRDILPKIFPHLRESTPKKSLTIARITTFAFTFATIIIAFFADNFGGVLGLIVLWFGALVGPIAIPMLLGLLPAFKKCNSLAAIASIFAGITVFALTKILKIQSLGIDLDIPAALEVSLPLIVSGITYIVIGLSNRDEVPENVNKLLKSLEKNETAHD